LINYSNDHDLTLISGMRILECSKMLECTLLHKAGILGEEHLMKHSTISWKLTKSQAVAWTIKYLLRID